jgi:hypothetical protein
LIRAHNAFLREKGWPEETRLYAHGQGYELVERPAIREDETMEIKANMNLFTLMDDIYSGRRPKSKKPPEWAKFS